MHTIVLGLIPVNALFLGRAAEIVANGDSVFPAMPTHPYSPFCVTEKPQKAWEMQNQLAQYDPSVR